MSLADLRNSLKSIKSLEKATGAMRVLAMSLCTSLKKEVPYFQNICKSFENLKNETALTPKQFSNNVIHVFIGSSRGLCGSYNNEIAKTIINVCKSVENEKEKIFKIFIGKQCALKVPQYISSDTIIISNFKRKLFDELENIIIKHAIDKNAYKIVLHYAGSVNLFKYIMKKEEIFLEYENNTSKIKDIFYGHFDKSLVNYILIRKLNKYKIQSIFIEAILAEQSARFVAMDGANKNARDGIHDKNIIYNKLRQTLITKELQDLVCGSL
jgi:F-type H+-transporting ATPase subunit gamma